MIKLVKQIPDFGVNSLEYVKINALYNAYKNDDNVLFWVQDNGKCLISAVGGNMQIFDNGAELGELDSFLSVIAPHSIFASFDLLCHLGRKPSEKLYVVFRHAEECAPIEGDYLSSKELYELLSVPELSLPDYPDFAVDYCHRLNVKTADSFAFEGKCAAITFNCGTSAFINGIVSREKGFGRVAMNGIIAKNSGRKVFACCRENVLGFYIKNGFEPLGYCGYWVNNK